jgi:hypothetical protein
MTETTAARCRRDESQEQKACNRLHGQRQALRWQPATESTPARSMAVGVIGQRIRSQLASRFGLARRSSPSSAFQGWENVMYFQDHVSIRWGDIGR